MLSPHTQGCILALLSMLWPHNSNPAYLARHWACAIDVVELVATLRDSCQPESGGTAQPWNRKTLGFVRSLIPSLDEAYRTLIKEDIGSLTLRQSWGLTVRCERAIRAAAPHWGAIEAAGWSSVAGRIYLITSRMLTRLVNMRKPGAWTTEEDAAGSLLLLLASNTATLLKFARHSRLMDEDLLQSGLIRIHHIVARCSALGPACQPAIKAAGPTIFFMLAPRHTVYAIQAAPSWYAARASGQHHSQRTLHMISPRFWLHCMVSTCCSLVLEPRLSLLALSAQPMAALLHLVMEEVEHSPEWCTPDYLDAAIATLSLYMEVVTLTIHDLASSVCKGTAAGPSQLLDMLAQPVLSLLGSQLLDVLAMLQHIPTEMNSTYQYCHPSIISPLNRADTAASEQVITARTHGAKSDSWGR